MNPRFALALALGLALPGAAMSQPSFPEVAKLPIQAELPDPLILLNGERVTTPEQWASKRRPELKLLFQHYMYGYFPEAPKIESRVEREDKQALNGKATLKEVVITLGPPEVPKLYLLLVVPNQRPGPAPTFVGLNFRGNHTVLHDPKIRLPGTWVPNVKGNRASDADRGSQFDVWAVDQTIERGYALATCYCGDIEPDRADRREGIQMHFLRKGQTALGPHDWGTIAAWAWGLQRLVDYLVTDSDIDAKRLAVVGHSRLGKTALLAAALDDRFALAIPHQAGCGGTAPSRGKIGESVQQINDRFPHWFNGTFKEFNDQPQRLPFDQHCLIALVAPRPVLLSNAVEDTWANPAGQFQMLQAAEPVYRLLDAGGLETKDMPPPGQLSAGKLGYFIRPGKHAMTREDWKVFLDFADRHLRPPTAK